MNNKIANITLDLENCEEKFQDFLLGINAEITRKGFFGGLSAEMLNNRKFFAGEKFPDGWECSGYEWIINQPEKSLCKSKFVVIQNGEIRQSSDSIALQENVKYNVRIWVKAYTEIVNVTYGVEGYTKTTEVIRNEEPYTELFFSFTALCTGLEKFVVRAEGCLAIFEVSLMPTENFYGMRWDVIEHLRTIAPTSIRFPGGCCADHFDWKESLKAPEFRKPADGSSKWFLFRDTYNQDCLDIGLHEFMMLCKELRTEPEYTVSLLLSDGEDARQLVEYCNGSAETEFGAMRQSRGYDPFHIRLWYVGNEAYFFGGETYQHSTAAALRTNELIHAMRQADDTILTVVGLTWSDAFKPWNYDFVAHLDCRYEYVSYHNYVGILPDPSQGQNGLATCEMLEKNFMDGEDAGLNFYKNELFGDKFRNIRVCADEWNYSWGYGSSNALFFSNALQLHFFAKYAEKYHIDRAEFFMPVNEGMITVQGTEAKLESTGEMFRLMQHHCGGQIIRCRTDISELDILCTRREGDAFFMSVINRSAVPCRLCLEGYDIRDCREIHTGEFSFESNEWELIFPEETAVSGHSMLFVSFVPKK